MRGLGTIANVAAIIIGGLLGLVMKGGLKPHYQDALQKAMGLCTLFIGASGTLAGMFTVEGSGLTTGGSMVMIAALVIGTIIGEFFDFEEKLERLGGWLRDKAAGSDDSRFVEGFVTASLVVCVGAMAIVGSIQDGLLGDPSTLLTKSVMDGVIVAVFASSYGKGAIFSALPVGVLQGSITLLAALLAGGNLPPEIISNLSFLGSALIFCVGINLAFGPRFRVANMLPALVVGAVITWARLVI
ncbi:MAG: DUF554 domain-containing protein [Oscillospiraceae bacterium]|nr:DUF554 domain-containing protein [Oscillospiraceae bacterium]